MRKKHLKRALRALSDESDRYEGKWRKADMDLRAMQNTVAVLEARVAELVNDKAALEGRLSAEGRSDELAARRAAH